MGKSVQKFKCWVKSTYCGKKLRNAWQNHYLHSRSSAEKTFDKYRGTDVSPEVKKATVDDMMRFAKEHRFAFDEYLMYDFEKLSDEERIKFVPTLERIEICEKLNNPKNMAIFDDKSNSYEHFKKYYKRDLIYVEKASDFEKFKAFAQKHPQFIAKPFDGANGRGIKKFDVEGKDLSAFFGELLGIYKKGCVIEELIVQCEAMARMHPSSVNTVRLSTVKLNDRTVITHPFWRVGQGGNVVDNGGSGGIICELDIDTGKITATADELGRPYAVHPDSKVEMIGYQIPRFEEAKALAIELAEVIPDNRFTGWDLALTDDGWVLQEANDRGGFVGFQLMSKKGFREEIEGYLKELGLM